MIWLAGYATAGTLIGFLAGLLGIGGGMSLVPILAAMFTAQALAPDHNVHLALGTCMASIMFTSGASAREHHRLGAVDWGVARRIAPGLLTGILASSAAAGFLPQRVLALSFAVIVYAGATQILFGRKPHAARTLPGGTAMFAICFAIGGISGLVSAGGSFLTIPFMLFCGVPMRNAIATSAAISVPVGLAGTVGYIASGWHVPSLPPGSVGFVFLPALGALVATSMLTAPFGARAAHRLPVDTLKRIFAGALYLLATRMLVTYW